MAFSSLSPRNGGRWLSRLQYRVLYLLASLGLLLLGVTWLFQTQVMAPRFEALEQTRAEGDVQLILSRLNRELDSLDSLTDGYGELLSEQQSRQTSEVRTGILREADWIDEQLVLLLSSDGQILERRDLSDDGEPQFQSAWKPGTSHERASTLLNQSAGLWLDRDVPWALATCALAGGNHVLVARSLTPKNLEGAVGIRFALYPARGDEPETWSIDPTDTDSVCAKGLLATLRGSANIAFEASAPRDLSSSTSHALLLWLVNSLTTIVLIMVLFGFCLQSQIVAPIKCISTWLRGPKEDLSATPYLHRSDEIGHLAEVLRSLLHESRENERKLREAFEWREEELEAQVESRTEALALANAELERRVGEAHEQAREMKTARTAAEAATRAKSEFLANMSHEIRTPMTAILGYADILMDENLEVEVRRQHLSVIRQNGDHLLHVLNDILDLSKIEAGRITLERVACNVDDLMDNIESLMGERAKRKGLEFRVERKGQLPTWIETDPTRVRQILLNLVGNAIKFTRSGSVTVEMQMDAGDDSDVLRFDIVDTGVGLPAGAQERLFRAFSQGDSTTTRKFGGSGLGLVISQRLARMLGGDIQVSSKVGEGSRFSATVAVGALGDTKMRQRPAAVTATLGRTKSWKQCVAPAGGRILLAEDGRDNRKLIRFILEKAGWEVVVACDGAEAVEIARESREQGRAFDLILMDMQMPVMDGFEATRMLRALSWEGPIVALTASAMSGDRLRCVEAGCSEYASKPIERAKLLQLCKRLVQVPAALPMTLDEQTATNEQR